MNFLMELSMDNLGSNTATALKNYCDRYENLEDERKALKEDRKDLYTELKAKGLPSKGIAKLVSEAKKDSEKLAETRQEIKDAAGLLGITVFVAEHLGDDTDNPWPEPDREFAKQKVMSLQRIDEEDATLVEDMKELLKEAKGEGFEMIPKLVKIRRDPEDYERSSMLLKTYLKAIGVGPEA